MIVILSMVRGFKNGMVEEIVSIISLFVAVIVVFLFGVAVTGFMDRKMNSMVVAIVFILVIGFVFKLLSILFMSLKIIAGLPVIKLLNKTAGIILGFLEGIVFIWIAFLLFNYFDLGSISEYVIRSAGNNTILHFLYNNNILEQILGKLIRDNSYLAYMSSLK